MNETRIQRMKDTEKLILLICDWKDDQKTVNEEMKDPCKYCTIRHEYEGTPGTRIQII